MTEEQYTRFINSCINVSKKFNLVNPTTNKILLNGMYNEDEEKDTYERRFKKSVDLLKITNLGTPFSMSCYAISLLSQMGIDSYMIESQGKSWTNYVVLYKYGYNYLICDLASEVRKYEAVSSYLITKSDKEKDLTLEELDKISQMLKDNSNVSIPLERYFTKYDESSCNVIDLCENNQKLYNDLIKTPIIEFISKIEYQKVVKKTSF